MAQDKETARLLLKARGFSRLVTYEHWDEAKKELLATLAQMDTISDLNLKLPAEELKFELKLRSEIKRILYNWVGSIETVGTGQLLIDKKREEKEKNGFIQTN